MRHIRDPITGYCIICEKNNVKHFVAPNELDDGASSSHGSTDRSPSRSSRPPGKKTIYVNAYPNRSPSPSKKRPSSSLSLSSSSSSDNESSANSARKSTALSSRSTSKLVLVDRTPSPTPRKRSPSPVKGRQRSPDVEKGGRCCGRRCCEKTGRGTGRGFDDGARYNDRCCGYRNFETASYGAGTWGIRRWCAPLIALLALAALAGAIVGIIYGVKAMKAKKQIEDQTRQQVINYIKNSQQKYIIIGADQPCNAFNNFTKPVAPATTPRPNCNATTTKIIINPKAVLPTDPEWLLAYTEASSASGLLSPLTSLGDVGMLVWVAGSVVWASVSSLGFGLYG